MRSPLTHYNDLRRRAHFEFIASRWPRAKRRTLSVLGSQGDLLHSGVTHIYYCGNFRYRRVNACMAGPLFRAEVSHWILNGNNYGRMKRLIALNIVLMRRLCNSLHFNFWVWDDRLMWWAEKVTKFGCGERHLLSFADDCVTRASCTQKTFGRAFKELSNDWRLTEVWLKMSA